MDMCKFQCSTCMHLCMLSILCIAIAVVGCGKRTLSTIPVEGKVTWKGQPLSSGDIAFHPTQLAEGGVNRIGIGRLDAEGKFKISTVTHGDGVQPGDYAVVIISRGGATRRIDPIEGSETSNIPVVYASITTTPLKATIAADAQIPVRCDFDLKE